jgi:hypothetical protein
VIIWHITRLDGHPGDNEGLFAIDHGMVIGAWIEGMVKRREQYTLGKRQRIRTSRIGVAGVG